jgi:hypothetical protein
MHVPITHRSKTHQASFEVNTLLEPVGPLRRELIASFNDYHEAVASGNQRAMQELNESVPPLLDEFDRTESWETANPRWMQAKMRAGWHVARGKYELALDFERAGWKHAEAEEDRPETREATARRKSISASNIADELRRLGRTREALRWGRLSVELWTSNPINHLVLAMILYRAGYRDAADWILEELRRMADFRSGHDVLAHCMSYERELHEMDDLLSVRRLLTDIAEARNTARADF